MTAASANCYSLNSVEFNVAAGTALSCDTVEITLTGASDLVMS
jgi:hypothetical protein